jgi:polyferredoxin
MVWGHFSMCSSLFVVFSLKFWLLSLSYRFCVWMCGSTGYTERYIEGRGEGGGREIPLFMSGEISSVLFAGL